MRARASEFLEETVVGMTFGKGIRSPGGDGGRMRREGKGIIGPGGDGRGAVSSASS